MISHTREAMAQIANDLDASVLGLAPHYPLLYAAARGLEAAKVLEFGAGGSSRVLLGALHNSGGLLFSVAPDGYGYASTPEGMVHISTGRWRRQVGTSAEARAKAFFWQMHWDLVLHDGSHDAATVREDLLAAMARVKLYGLVFVHDTQHEKHGEALCDVLAHVPTEFSMTTLPYGFGLTIMRREVAPDGWPEVIPAWEKVGSPWRTVPRPVAVRRWPG